MTGIVNKAKLAENDRINALRAAIQHRATWMALMFLEMEKEGCDAEKITRAAVRKTGRMHGEMFKERIRNPADVRDFKEVFLTDDGIKIFEMDINASDEKQVNIDFNYCALVEAWKRLGISDEKTALLCDIAMDGDRGIAEAMGYEFELGDTIAKKCKTCQVKFYRR
ncbi:MAG: L-2-amino-thiazoline-4-carboxylic acid hydrolase [Bacillota bacterium]|nr:L-2-amino-thiazoline-4-carboxylic acid hydrolase [Bacillota bacterium]MDW7678781.1 L-2-amino-thiazoline-4-carboxylic acid hydrolase [Bacillota bacterium]